MSGFIYTGPVELELSHALIGEAPDCVIQIVEGPKQAVTNKKQCATGFYCFDYSNIFTNLGLNPLNDKLAMVDLSVKGAVIETSFINNTRIGVKLSGGVIGGTIELCNVVGVGPFVFSAEWFIHAI